jgi:hypothetical protein
MSGEMKVDVIIERLEAATSETTKATLRQTARALGAEMERRRPDVLAKFRAQACRVKLPDVHAQAYLEALLDVCRAYENDVRQKDREEGLKQLVVGLHTYDEQGEIIHLREVLSDLREKPQTADDLKKNFGVNQRLLDELVSIHELLQHYEGSPYYTLSLLGLRVLEQV